MAGLSVSMDFIADSRAPYIIAEVGANHNGDMGLARQMINAAKECGCDAVKFQSWTPDSLIAQEEYVRNQKYYDSPKKHFGSLREMCEKYYLRKEQHYELFEYCGKAGIEFCSSHFSTKEADLLNEIGVRFFKVASMDVNNHSLLKYTASFGRPIVLSTGMATIGEIDAAVKVVESQGNNNLALLHCISIYPPEYKDVNLNNIPMLRRTFGYPAGFSDHSSGDALAVASVALGCRMIEKHFTLDKNLPGWDHEISADPEEMTRLVKGCKAVYMSLGTDRRVVSSAEEQKKLKFRRSLVAVKPLAKGHVLSEGDLVAKRPGDGIPPDELKYVAGRKLRRDIGQDEKLGREDLE